MTFRVPISIATLAIAQFASAQSPAPSVSQVLMFSATGQLTVPLSTGGTATLRQAIPSIFTQTAVQTNLSAANFGSIVLNGSNYSVSQNLVQVNNSLNASIATALSIIPLSSPASGVIVRKDPTTGAELPVSSTLGPIFSERAETIGKRRFYIGFSHQNFHFNTYNGQSLNGLSVLYPGGDNSAIAASPGANTIRTVPATFKLGMDIRLSQNIAFLTYGVTDRFDISVGLPAIHSSVAARTFDGTIYAGNGFGNPTCWCVNTFTPGFPTLIQNQIGQSSLSKTGFGDILLRGKATVLRRPGGAIAVGADFRLPTGEEENYHGIGTVAFKPFMAVSLYSKPLAHGIVLSPHFDFGWQFTGKSILGGELVGTPLTQDTAVGRINYVGAPFTTTKGYLPDVFSWAAGAEIALGRRNTVVADFLGNQIGLVHGISNTKLQTVNEVYLPTGPNGSETATPTRGSATGLVGSGKNRFGQYSGSFGYKARIAGNLIANFNVVVRLDENGLRDRVVPLVGLGYSF